MQATKSKGCMSAFLESQVEPKESGGKILSSPDFYDLLVP